MKSWIAAIGVVVALSGCGTQKAYEGPERPFAEQALIVGSPQLTSGVPIKAVIRKVDDQVSQFGTSTVAVLPGRHEILVDCVMSNHSTVRFPITLQVQAGHRYVLTPESTPGNRTCADVRVDER